MTSFAKVCVDISNNLKNFRFSNSQKNTSDKKADADSATGNRNTDNFVDKLFDVYLNGSLLNNNIPENGKESASRQNSPSNGNHSSSGGNQQYSFVNRYGTSSTSSSPVMPRSKKITTNPHGYSSNNDCSQTESDEEKFYNPYVETLRSSSRYKSEKNQSRPSPIQMPPFSPTLSHRVYSLAQKVTELNSPKQRTGVSSACNSPIMSPRGTTVNAIKQRLFSQGMRVDFGMSNGFRIGMFSSRFRDYMRRHLHRKQVNLKNILLQDSIMDRIFQELNGSDLINCCLVCKKWMEFLMEKRFYERVCLLLDFKERHRFLSTIKGNPGQDDIEMGLSKIIRMGIFRNISELRLKNVLEKDVSLILNSIQLCKDFQDLPSEMTKQIPPSVSRDSTDSNISENSLNSTRSSSSGIGSSLGSCGKILTPSTTMKASIQEEANSCRSSISIKTIIPNSKDPPSPNSGHDEACSSKTEESVSLLKGTYTFYDSLSIYDSSMLDMSIEQILRLFVPLKRLDLRHCNDISEICLWNILQPTITHLTIYDCINIADESFAAICQLLPNLTELNIQAYHISNRAVTYFSKEQTENLKILRFVQCLEVTNQGFINLAQMLNNLTHLSLYGCSKLTDDGLDIICENFKMLEHLDLSWCLKLTDGGLECVACDLTRLRTLKLDKCIMITDNGIRHLSCMKSLWNLTLRWCCLITDSGIIHILGVSDLIYLSLAGCKGITSHGFVNLIKHKNLRVIELTNCPLADPATRNIIRQNINNCILIS